MTAPVKGREAVSSLLADDALVTRLFKKQELKGLDVDVETTGNQLMLVRVIKNPPT